MKNAVWICTLSAAAALAAGGLLEATLDRMDQAAARFKDLSADIRRVHHTNVINEDTVDSGTILLKRPKPHDVRAFFDIKQPDPKQVSIDSHKAQLYYPKIATVQDYDLGKYKSLADQFLLLGFGSTSKELESAYKVSLGGPETLGTEKTTRIELIPKSPDTVANLQRVELWISDASGLPVQQKLYWPGGDYDLATYMNIKVNPNLPDSAFKLNLPKGVKREYPQK